MKYYFLVLISILSFTLYSQCWSTYQIEADKLLKGLKYYEAKQILNQSSNCNDAPFDSKKIISNKLLKCEKILKPKLPNLIPYKKLNKYGFCNFNKDIIIETKYDFVEPFIGNFAIVKLDGKKGIINRNNKIVIPFDNYFDFTIKKTSVNSSSNFFIFIYYKKDSIALYKNGNIILPKTYKYISIEDSAIFCCDSPNFNDHDYDVYDLNGKFLFKMKGNWVNLNKDEFIIKINLNNKSELFDIYGNKLLDEEYNYISFLENHIRLMKDGHSLLLDYKLNNILSSYQDAEIVDDFIIYKKHGKIGVIDIYKNTIIPLYNYSYIKYNSKHKLFLVSVSPGKGLLDEKYGVIDINGKIIVPILYKNIKICDDKFITAFTSNLSFASQSKKSIIFDLNGKVKLENNDGIMYLNVIEGNIIVRKTFMDETETTLYGILSFKEETIIPFKYDNLEETSTKNIFWYSYGYNKKCGFVNSTGVEFAIINPNYGSYSRVINKGLLIVSSYNQDYMERLVVYNKEGKMLVDKASPLFIKFINEYNLILEYQKNLYVLKDYSGNIILSSISIEYKGNGLFFVVNKLNDYYVNFIGEKYIN